MTLSLRQFVDRLADTALSHIGDRYRVSLADMFESVERLRVVTKPRDGAGSVDTFLIRSGDDWRRLGEVAAVEECGGDIVVQPFVPGKAASVESGNR